MFCLCTRETMKSKTYIVTALIKCSIFYNKWQNKNEIKSSMKAFYVFL